MKIDEQKQKFHDYCHHNVGETGTFAKVCNRASHVVTRWFVPNKAYTNSLKPLKAHYGELEVRLDTLRQQNMQQQSNICKYCYRHTMAQKEIAQLRQKVLGLETQNSNQDYTHQAVLSQMGHDVNGEVLNITKTTDDLPSKKKIRIDEMERLKRGNANLHNIDGLQDRVQLTDTTIDNTQKSANILQQKLEI